MVVCSWQRWRASLYDRDTRWSFSCTTQSLTRTCSCPISSSSTSVMVMMLRMMMVMIIVMMMMNLWLKLWSDRQERKKDLGCTDNNPNNQLESGRQDDDHLLMFVIMKMILHQVCPLMTSWMTVGLFRSARPIQFKSVTGWCWWYALIKALPVMAMPMATNDGNDKNGAEHQH